MALPARLPFTPLAFLAGTLLTGGAVAAGCIVDWADDCGRDRGYPNCHGALSTITGGSTGTGGTGGSSSGGEDAGEGGMTGCKDAGACPPPPPGPCAALGMATCTDGVCGVTYTAGPAPSQVYGNCHKNVCDANGVMTTEVDTTNTYSNGNDCTPFSCTAAGQVFPGNRAGMGCNTFMGSSAGFCEPDPESGVITCSECDPSVTNYCITVLQVPATICSVNGTCNSQACFDGQKNNNETDMDCGGNSNPNPNMRSGCPACADGKACVLTGVGGDCLSGVCSPTTKTCTPHSCSDNVKNGTETDIDCGGNCSNPCAPGATCLVASDCSSMVCWSPAIGTAATCQSPSCTDGVQNGNETGVDCGGDGGCQPCSDGGT